MKFFFKVLRNAFILSGLFFISIFSVGELSYSTCKPLIIFFLTYIFGELARYYKLSMPSTPKRKTKKIIPTFIFS